MRTYKFRLYPSRQHQQILEEQFLLCCGVYNDLLAVRFNEGFSRFELQNETLRDLKICNPRLKNVYSQVLQDLSRRVSTSFDAYHRRLRDGIRPAGKPRFKTKKRFTSMTYPQSGFTLDGKKLNVSKIGRISIKCHRNIEGKIKTLTITKNGVGDWYACFTIDVPSAAVKHPFPERAVGLDAGLTHLLATSAGDFIANQRFLRQSEKKLTRSQCALSRKKRGSKNRGKARQKVAKTHCKISSQRKDYLHKMTRRLVDSYGLIVAENLHIQHMMKNRQLAKSIGDAGWGMLFEMLCYKAESAGSVFVQISPQYTSQECLCGTKVKKTIRDRRHACPVCGTNEDRDTHASKILLERYRRNYGNSSLTENLWRGSVTQDATGFSPW